MPELSEHLNSTTSERTLQTARKLAEDLIAKGFGVVNGMCTGSQLDKSVLTQAWRSELQKLSSPTDGA